KGKDSTAYTDLSQPPERLFVCAGKICRTPAKDRRYSLETPRIAGRLPLFTTHYSQLAIHNSLFTTHYSQLTTHSLHLHKRNQGMDNFIVSARKYRPQTFNTVVGQAHITTTLKNAIKNRQLAHAFLFCGPRGVGKTTCARILAKTINCENMQADGEACNVCESCKSFNDGASLNIHELDAASNNSVDDIRTLTEQVRFSPQAGKYKVYIIDEVHMLSSSAFNAFLKTL